MSENTNTFITGEVYPYQITDRTLSFIPKLSPAADDHFKELVTGKIKISLYDFSNGKGDNGIYTYFNLDLKQFRYIYERAKLSHLPAPYESSKIHCQSVETDGPFKGYCKSFRFYLARNATYIDKKTGETCTMRAPWYLKITNGYAIPGKDGKGEQRNSFKQTSSAYINLSDEDFLDRMESIHIYIKEYTHIVAQNSLAANLKKLDDIYKRGEYDPNLPSEAHSSTQQQTTPADPNVPQQAATTNSQPTQSNPVLPDMPELHTMELKITSNFQAMENSYVVKCEIDGRVYLLYCNNPVPKELIEAQKSGATITARLCLSWRAARGSRLFNCCCDRIFFGFLRILRCHNWFSTYPSIYSIYENCQKRTCLSISPFFNCWIHYYINHSNNSGPAYIMALIRRNYYVTKKLECCYVNMR